MEHKFTIFLILALFVSLTHHQPARAKIPAVIVFGDSSVDSGNNNRISTVLKRNFQQYGRDFDGGRTTGRFSNGKIPPDYISAAFGLKSEIPAYLDPGYDISDFATGVCFASAGIGYDNATSKVLETQGDGLSKVHVSAPGAPLEFPARIIPLSDKKILEFVLHKLQKKDTYGVFAEPVHPEENMIPLWKELEYFIEYQGKLKAYVGDKKAKEIIKESLYLMSIGTNDFMENYFLLPTRSSHYTVGQYLDFLLAIAGNFVRELYRLGGRILSLEGLPPMGCLPLERTTNILGHHDCSEEYNNVAMEYNAKLKILVAKLNKELPGMKILAGRTYNVFYHIIRYPSRFGFEVAEVVCCATGMFEMGFMCNKDNPFTCTDENKYVFWDAFHPTEKTNRLISEHIIPHLKAVFP